MADMAFQLLAGWRKVITRLRTSGGTAGWTRRLRLECLEARAVPATFTVNPTLDDVTPGNGKQSLREAITRANATPEPDVITLPAGVFRIAIPGPGENANASGDFDITATVTIRGAGAGLSIINAQQV